MWRIDYCLDFIDYWRGRDVWKIMIMIIKWLGYELRNLLWALIAIIKVLFLIVAAIIIALLIIGGLYLLLTNV